MKMPRDENWKTQVYLTTGDDYIRNNKIEKIDLLKIDVEGHEIQVLTGFEKAILKNKPIILMEWSAAKTINESRSSNLFQNISHIYKPFVAISSRNKSLWNTGFSGRMWRISHKLLNEEKWYLYPADLNMPHANVFLVHPDKISLISDIIYKGG